MANDTTTGAPVTGSDPFQEAEQNPLPVQQTVWERLNTGSGIPMVDEAMKRDFMQKQAQANLYHKNAADINGLLYHLADPEARKSYINPQTGQPYTDDDIQQLQAQVEHATGQYEKLVGVDKQSKNALQKARSIVDFIHGNRRAAMQPPPTPQYGATVTSKGVIPTPIPGTNVGEAGVSPGEQQQQLTPPPLSPLQEATRASTQLPFATHPAKVGQRIADSLQLRKATYQQDIQTRTEEAQKLFGDVNSTEAQRYILTGQMPFARLQHTNMVDPDTGEILSFNPITGEHENSNGVAIKNPVQYQKPLMTEIEDKNSPEGHFTGFEQYGKLYDQNWNQLPAGTKKFYSQMAPRQTQTNTFEKVQQLDGSTALVPVTKTSTMTRGGMPPPPGRPGGAPPAPAQPGETTVGKPNFGPQSRTSPSPQGNAATALGLPPGSRIVGGKVPPGVAKSYETYNGSVERYKVMQKALPQALAGNQQAMINLLYNHIGMTTGLQKGARITQPIIDEAQNSAPLVATILKKIGVDKEFTIDPTILRGVVLDSATMHNMIELAHDRTTEDYSAWQREIASSKTGYGMSTPPPATPPDIQPTGKTGGKPSSFKPF